MLYQRHVVKTQYVLTYLFFALTFPWLRVLKWFHIFQMLWLQINQKLICLPFSMLFREERDKKNFIPAPNWTFFQAQSDKIPISRPDWFSSICVEIRRHISEIICKCFLWPPHIQMEFLFRCCLGCPQVYPQTPELHADGDILKFTAAQQSIPLHILCRLAINENCSFRICEWNSETI